MNAIAPSAGGVKRTIRLRLGENSESATQARTAILASLASTPARNANERNAAQEGSARRRAAKDDHA